MLRISYILYAMSIIIPEVELSVALSRKMPVEQTPEHVHSYRDHTMLSAKESELVQVRSSESNDRRSHSCEEKIETASDISSTFGRLELGSTYEWSDSSSLSDPADSEFHETIEAIREEAARIDTIMALDQLDTMKQELEMQKKIVEARRLEVHDLRDLVSLKDDLLSSVELERDLLRAENAKLKDEIAEANNAQRGRDAEETLHVTRIHPVAETQPIVLVSEANVTSVCSSDAMQVATIDVEHAHQHSEVVNVSHGRQSGRSADDETIVQEIRGREGGKSCLFVPRALFRKKRRSDCRDESIREIGRMLRTSLDANEVLRKRIAVLSAYYENMVERMQANLNEVQLEKNRMATDLATQIVRLDEAHRRTVDDLQRKLRQKDRELATVRAVQL